MFTGIVQGIAQIHAIKDSDNFRTQIVKLPAEMRKGLEIGASVANNGVCLTVTEIHDDFVNIERAMQMGAEIGGHVLSGHVYCTASVSQIIESENNRQVWFKLPNKDVMKYILTKGFIAIDGISLTIGEVKDDEFCVNLIPETLHRTLIGKRQIGDLVNIEIDPQTQAIVDTVERYLAAKA